MTKAELIDIVAEKVDGVTKAQVADIYNAIFDTIERAVKEDAKHRYTVQGFGTFEMKERKARQGRNPKTGETIEIAAKTVMDFRGADALEDRLSGK